MQNFSVCIFDAYGTLFDVNAAARAVAAEPGREGFAALWPKLAEDWRNKQLQYSWLRAASGQHCDFWQVTQDALDWALEAALLNDPGLRARLLALYWELPAYPEAAQVLARLQAAGIPAAILSNGSPDMLEAAATSAGIAGALSALLSVESVGVFKPHPSVYALVGAQFGCRADQVLFVSANGWDAAFAAKFGFTTAWINRNGAPLDRLPAAPHHIFTDLTAIPELARS
jgi:2-haloacid dehalogenase